MEERLQKFLADCGIASRRRSEDLIRQGLVAVNGSVVTKMGQKIDPDKDEVTFRGQKVTAEQPLTTVMINKPAGYVTTAHDQFARPCVTDLVDMPGLRLYPVGRLDYQTTGLLLLTNDGELTNYLTHPGHHIPKTYEAKLKGAIGEKELGQLRNGVLLDDGYRTSPAQVELIMKAKDYSRIRITIYEGKNHQVRRMAKAVGFPVLKLKRIQEGPLKLGNLKEGQYRILSDSEIQSLKSED